MSYIVAGTCDNLNEEKALEIGVAAFDTGSISLILVSRRQMPRPSRVSRTPERPQVGAEMYLPPQLHYGVSNSSDFPDSGSNVSGCDETKHHQGLNFPTISGD